MITTKHARCCRWTWGYVTRYPHASPHDIAGAQLDYSEREIVAALSTLQGQGYVARDSQHAGWIALVPFVVEAPVWSR